jgi:hypothetical protein
MIPNQMNETNYCDQSSVTMEFSFEEHDLLNDVLNHASEALSLAIPCVYDLPEDSEIRQRYEDLERLRQFSYALWAKRFGNSIREVA